MKRCWLGAGLLLLMLVLGLIFSSLLGRFGRELSREAARAGALAEENRAEAVEILEAMEGKWQRNRPWLAVLWDHRALREADTLFALLTGSPEGDTFRENVLRLAQALRDLADAQKPSWENIF